MRQIQSLMMTACNNVGYAICKSLKLLNLTNLDKNFIISSIICLGCIIWILFMVGMQLKKKKKSYSRGQGVGSLIFIIYVSRRFTNSEKKKMIKMNTKGR